MVFLLLILHKIAIFNRIFIVKICNNYLSYKREIIMNNSHMKKFDSFDDFFGKRIFPKFLIFSYIGLFLAILYLPFDYSVYKNTPNLTDVLIARFIAIFFAVMVVLSLKMNFFANYRVIAITTFGTLGYSALTFSYISNEAPSFFVMYNWFFYLVATMML